MMTLPAASRMDAASSALALRYGRCCACAWEVWICPNAPNSTLVNDRFMALHMMIERISPDEPSSAPATTNRLLPNAKPMAQRGAAGGDAQHHDENHAPPGKDGEQTDFREIQKQPSPRARRNDEQREVD